MAVKWQTVCHDMSYSMTLIGTRFIGEIYFKVSENKSHSDEDIVLVFLQIIDQQWI